MRHRRGRFPVRAQTCSITTVTPTSGPVSTSLTISGSSFGPNQGSNTVTIGGVAATATAWNPNLMIVPVPVGAAVGPGSIVLTIDGNVCTKAFTVTSSGGGECSPGSFPDCNGVCDGPSLWDCGQHTCYNPTNGGTPVWGADCAGVCFQIGTNPVNKPDCTGRCFGPNTEQGIFPRNAPDCLGECYGADLPDVVPTVLDCNGVCGGLSYYDCSGQCVTNPCVSSSGKKAFKTYNSKRK